MKRDIYRQLEGWKKSDRCKLLIINGSRRFGKICAFKHFDEIQESSRALNS
ncbi:MAG: hypothetical protein JSS09_01305 [Verrucomicrobia bacterium]|nr:hypothetical protein [Verrucomicrobiota bacterium]